MASKFFNVAAINTYMNYATNGRVIAFDTETTGFHNHDEVIQIAAIEYVKGEKTRTFCEYIKTDLDIPAEVTLVNGITKEMLEEKGKPRKETLDRFVDFVGDDCLLVAHNIDFDLRMLFNEFKRNDIAGRGNTLVGCDTCEYTKVITDGTFPNYKLQTCINCFALDAINNHNALYDAEACGKLFFRLANK